MFGLNFTDQRPLYEQIKEKIKGLIISGVLEENARIPSVRELSVSLSLNPNTIQKAYKDLENEGYIYSIRAKGSFVAPVQADSPQLFSLFEQFDATVRELRYIGITKPQLSDRLNSLYQSDGGMKHD